MLVRLVVVALAAAVIVVMAGRLRDDRDCRRAQAALTAAGAGHPGTLTSRRAAARSIRDHCAGSAQLASAAVLIGALGDRSEARRLATTAARREPKDFASWVSVALTAGTSRPRAAREAVARARELNPRWRLPAGVRPSSSSAGGP
jgi:hypothetical protein